MRIKCEYCGGFIDDSEEKCQNCGAPNLNLKRQASNVPTTIEELQGWYIQQNLPPKEVTRFFIGEDYKGTKAYGIYREEGSANVVVYKNKADGSRAIRYRGKDEAYAVNELYMKLKETILQQKKSNLDRKNYNNNINRNKRTNTPGTETRKRRIKQASLINLIVWATFIIIFLSVIVSAINTPNRGYYNYNGGQYYYLDNDWYSYDYSTDSWGETSVDDELYDNYDEYYESNYYDDSYNTSDFSDTSYYDDWHNSTSNNDSWDSSWDSGWDSDSSWDSGDSWGDSGGWDSDW